MKYEWDENKNENNKKIHEGVSFEEAQTVFADPMAMEFNDEDHSEDEDRFIVIGHSVKSRILIVVFCERSGDTIRIITARKAEKSEIRDYEDGI